MISHRFPDAMGDVVEEGDFDDHAAALAWARDGDHDEDVQRVEHIGPQREGAGWVRCSTDIEGTL